MNKSEASDYFWRMLFEPILRKNLAAVASSFAEHLGLSLSTVARRYLSDDRAISRIQEGASFSVRFYDRSISRFASEWPADLDWPEGIPRPTPAEIAEAKARPVNSRAKDWS